MPIVATLPPHFLLSAHRPPIQVNLRAMLHTFRLSIILLACLTATGCALPRYDWILGQEEAANINNTVFVSADNFEAVWERTVDVIHDYRFPIRRENKLDGIIETEYKVGASVLEPWHRDSVGIDARLVSTLQSIRRRMFVSVTPADGGFLVSVEAFQEIEDVVGQPTNTAGSATFQDSSPLQRELSLVGERSRPSGWVPQGRDIRLEQATLARLQKAFSR